MKKQSNGSKTFVVWGSACAALIAVHLYMHSGDSEQAAKSSTVSRIAETSRSPNPDADVEAWAAWKSQREASPQDSRADRAAKGLTETMRGFRQQPVEFVEDEGKKSSLAVITSTSDLKAILDAGGSYSGPLPPELIDNAPAGDAATNSTADVTTKPAAKPATNQAKDEKKGGAP